MNKTPIEWTDYTWNVITGCYGPRGTPEKPNRCSYCYAHRMAKRLRGRAGYPSDDPFRPTLHEDKLGEPYHLRKPSRIFLGSMGDLFCLPDQPYAFGQDIYRILGAVAANPRHTFLVLTKQPERMCEVLAYDDVESEVWAARDELLDRCEGDPTGLERWEDRQEHPGNPAFVQTFAEWDPGPTWPLKNLWLGVSCENQAAANERIPHLLAAPAAHRFVSLEPLMDHINLYDACARPCSRCGGKGHHHGFGEGGVDPDWCTECGGAGIEWHFPDWVIIGAQSGPGAKPPDSAWVDSLVAQCRAAKVPVFCKNNLNRTDPPQEVPWR